MSKYIRVRGFTKATSHYYSHELREDYAIQEAVKIAAEFQLVSIEYHEDAKDGVMAEIQDGDLTFHKGEHTQLGQKIYQAWAKPILGTH